MKNKKAIWTFYLWYMQEAAKLNFNIVAMLPGILEDDDTIITTEITTEGITQVKVAIASIDTFGTAQIASNLITERLLTPAATQPQGQLAGMNLGGRTQTVLPPQPVQEDLWGNSEAHAWQHSFTDLIPNTDFVLPVSATDHNGGHYELWGSAGYTDLKGNPTQEGVTTEYDGKATGVHLGIGRRYVNGTGIGIAIGTTQAQLDLSGSDVTKVERNVLSVHPYIGFSLQNNLSAWLIAGFGKGDYDLEFSNDSKENTTASYTMYGGGLQRAWEVSGIDLAMRVEGTSTQSEIKATTNLSETKSSAWQARLEFEVGRTFTTATGGTIKPYGTFGYRHDGGDLGSAGAGELGLGLRSQLDAAWLIDLKTRFQATDTDHEQSSVYGYLKYDHDNDRQGFLFSTSHHLKHQQESDGVTSSKVIFGGTVGYGWGRSLFNERGVLDIHLKLGSEDQHDDPVVGLSFKSPSLQLDIDGNDSDATVNLNYVSNY